jgi:hypothetical protein
MLHNAKHEAVALAYLADPEKIGWRAYRKAYPKATQRAAESAFSRLLKNVEFAARVAGLAEQATTGIVMAAAEVLEGISEIARKDESSKTQLRAYELMGKHHKLFVDRVEHSFAGGIAERLAAALARTDGKKPKAEPDGEKRPHHDPPRRRGGRKAARKGKRARA